MKLQVKDTGERPAGKPGFCFYCRKPTSEPHEKDCVIPKRSVVLRMEVEMVVDVPDHWTPENIEFHRNDGTWCTSNAFQELARATDKPNANCGCSCSKFTFLREATKEDHEKLVVTIASDATL
jgi:hypothetical protein